MSPPVTRLADSPLVPYPSASTLNVPPLKHSVHSLSVDTNVEIDPPLAAVTAAVPPCANPALVVAPTLFAETLMLRLLVERLPLSAVSLTVPPVRSGELA